MKFIFLGRESVFSVSWPSPGGPLWPLNSGPFACLYGGGPQITRPPSEKVASLSQEIQIQKYSLMRQLDLEVTLKEKEGRMKRVVGQHG